MKEILGQSLMIAGFGREGQSILRYLEKNHPLISITVADEKPYNVSEVKGFSFVSGAKYLESASDFDTVVHSPSIPKNTPEFLKAKHITSATNIFFSECPGTIIGVTGTKGKSTTSSLIQNILATTFQDVRLVGNIGYPALDKLPGATSKTVFVMEASSYQLDDIRYSPHIAVILPIVPEHLNYHGSFDEYVKAKGHIVEKQTRKDFVIYHGNNEYSRKIALKSQGQQIPYGITENGKVSAWVEDKAIWVSSSDFNPQILLPTHKLPLLGQANFENVTASIVASIIMGVDFFHIREALLTFKPLDHRLQPVGEFSGIKFYNDSLATIPEATIHALDALGDEVATLIAGGYDRGLDMQKLGPPIAKSSVKTLILFPDTGEKIAQAVKTSNPINRIDILFINSMKEAVQIAFQKTPKGKICLMSPASASFNLFKDYADRGEQFMNLVRNYSENF
jgi:UDP-N-acetylmuramoylalanine--D-glutamate ligase